MLARPIGARWQFATGIYRLGLVFVPPGHLNAFENSSDIKIPLIEGSLEVKLPTIWTVEKQR